MKRDEAAMMVESDVQIVVKSLRGNNAMLEAADRVYTGLCPPFPPFRLVLSRDKRLLVRSAVMGFQLRRRDRRAGSRNKRRGLISFSVVKPGE
jgi:hypothetical protein